MVMLEILVTIGVVVALAAAAKKGGGKRRRYLKGNVSETLSLGALATQVVILGPMGETVNERTLVSSLVAQWSLRDHVEGEGPIEVGVAHGDYTTAEIQAYVDNSGSWNEGDLVNQEIAQRKVRKVGTFGAGPGAPDELNDGKPVKTKLNWILTQGQTIDIWAFNRDDGSLTTGIDVIVDGHINLWPQ